MKNVTSTKNASTVVTQSHLLIGSDKKEKNEPYTSAQKVQIMGKMESTYVQELNPIIEDQGNKKCTCRYVHHNSITHIESTCDSDLIYIRFHTTNGCMEFGITDQMLHVLLEEINETHNEHKRIRITDGETRRAHSLGKLE